MMRLWRAADDDYVSTGISFATERAVAKAYLDNPGYGGATLYRTRVDSQPALDLTESSTADLAELLGIVDPGAIGIDEWIPRSVQVQDLLRELGYLWAIVPESYPHGTQTWIWLGTSDDDEPELEPA